MNNNFPPAVQKYLNKYGCDKWKLRLETEEKFDYAIIVPAISEYENCINLLNSLAENQFDNKNAVLIFVINNMCSSSEEVKNENQKTLKLLDAIRNNDIKYHRVVQKFNSSALGLGYVDASSRDNEMPDKTGGVGLARKIGMDLVLTAFDYSKPGRKIIISLDADCTVEMNYIDEVINSFQSQNLDAAVISYEHPLPEEEEKRKAIICYETTLRYFELGLKYAGSYYAYQVVGSTMAFSHEAYIKVEGMNKRKAAEDFYFLEKIAKNFRISEISSTKVFPSARSSWRVPFGTGQRVNRFLSHSRNEYLLYDPETFKILKQWLKVFNSEINLSAEDFLAKAKEIHPELYNFLMKNNFMEDWGRIFSNSKDANQLKKQKLMWFDAFRTLKLIHHLRDTSFPMINMSDALEILFNLNNSTDDENRKE